MPEVATACHEKFEYTVKMTSKTYPFEFRFSEKQNIETKPFRRALQVYVQNLFGYVNEDFDYGTVFI